jgi:protein-S-isoprenylcysteine O-methyltransferase Ste14
MLRIPPPIWALAYLVLTAGVSALAGWPTLPYLHNLPVGIVLIAASLVAPIWAVAKFRGADTQLNPASVTNNALVTDGPFRFTRNPMYLGLVILTLGIAVATGWLPMFAAPVLTFATTNWIHIPFEEAKMQHQFGAAFDAYRRTVRRWA